MRMPMTFEEMVELLPDAPGTEDYHQTRREMRSSRRETVAEQEYRVREYRRALEANTVAACPFSLAS